MSVPDSVFLQMAVQFGNMQPDLLRKLQAKQKQLAAQGREFSLFEIARRTKTITPDQAEWFVQYHQNQSGDGLVSEPADDEEAEDHEAEDSPDPDEAYDEEDEDDGPRAPRKKSRLGGSRGRVKAPKKKSRLGKGSRVGAVGRGSRGGKKKGPQKRSKFKGRAPGKRGAGARARFEAAAAAEREGVEEEGGGLSWMIWVGIFILVVVLSAIFNDSDREQERTSGGYVIVRGGKKVYRGK